LLLPPPVLRDNALKEACHARAGERQRPEEGMRARRLIRRRGVGGATLFVVVVVLLLLLLLLVLLLLMLLLQLLGACRGAISFQLVSFKASRNSGAIG